MDTEKISKIIDELENQISIIEWLHNTEKRDEAIIKYIPDIRLLVSELEAALTD